MVLHAAVCAFIVHGIENMLRPMRQTEAQHHWSLYVDIVSFIGQGLAEWGEGSQQVLQKK